MGKYKTKNSVHTNKYHSKGQIPKAKCSKTIEEAMSFQSPLLIASKHSLFAVTLIITSIVLK